MITVPNLRILTTLPSTPADGEYAYVEDEQTIFQYHAGEEDGWSRVSLSEGELKLTLADINQNIMAQIDPMTDEQLRILHSSIFRFLGESMKDQLNDYWALICWDRRYITIFHHDDKLIDKPDSEELSDVIMEILESLGDIKDYSTEKDHLEIWITNEEDTYCYVLFNYKNGVVEGIG